MADRGYEALVMKILRKKHIFFFWTTCYYSGKAIRTCAKKVDQTIVSEHPEYLNAVEVVRPVDSGDKLVQLGKVSDLYKILWYMHIIHFLSIYLPIYLSFFLTIYLYNSQSIYLSIQESIYLSIYPYRKRINRHILINGQISLSQY